MSLYQVIGKRAYREHKPGEIFEAVLPPANEARAFRIRALKLIERSTPTIQPGSYTLPTGWALTKPDKEG